MKLAAFTIVLIFIPGLILPAAAQQLIIYPAKGQSSQQMEQDKDQCYIWAKQNTGYDPVSAPTTYVPSGPDTSAQGDVLRGAARGAAVGGVTGGIFSGKGGEGAAAGAAAGALFGGMKRRDRIRQEQQTQNHQAQQQAAYQAQMKSAFNRAYSACLEAKGYTVK